MFNSSLTVWEWAALGVSLFLIYSLTYTGVRVYRLLQNSKILVAETVNYNRLVPSASQTIVVLGDSTAAGTGATSTDSIAGRLGALYTHATVHDYGVVGLKLKGLSSQLDSLPEIKANLVVVQIGANDITYFTNLSDIRAQTKVVLTKINKLKAPGGKVLVLHSGLVGNAPLFPTWLSWLWNNRTRAVRDIYIQEVPLAGATYVDLVNSSVDKIFANDPKKYYASDMFHPSGDGYGVWFEEVKKVL